MALQYREFVRNRNRQWANETPCVIAERNLGLKPKKLLSVTNYSILWRCYDRQAGASVVIKRYSPKCAELWAAELDAMEVIPFPHTNIIHYIDNDPEALTLTMKYVRGGDMRSYVLKYGGLSEITYAAVALQMCEAVRYIHYLGLAHRDIKLENWLYDAHREQPVLTDFGISCVVEAGEIIPADGAGTFIYQPIEMLTETSYDPLAADVWALAVSLRETAGDLTFEKAIDSEDTDYGLVVRYASIHDEYSDELWCLALNPIPTIRPTAEAMAQIFRESPWQRWTPPPLPLIG